MVMVAEGHEFMPDFGRISHKTVD